ncbi:MAG: DDE-type integrase/transposase/recombinase [Gordonia sp. (in: high G+C Gram-positive bacteria)]
MEKIAMFRYQLIREAADESVTSRQRGPMVKALAAQQHLGPFGGTVTVAKDTIDRWIRLWRRGGFEALVPRGRTQGPVTAPQILSLAATLKRERPARTAAQVRRIMIDTLGDAPSESTLLRHFRTLQISTGTREVFGRFEADYPNELWVGDGLHGPKIGGRKTYLFAFLDDHSRLVTAARWAFAEDSVRLTAALRPALESRGIPGAVYVDNGSAFADESLARTCARLGIRLIHSRPYRPQGRGKIERFFHTVTSQFLTEITIPDASGEVTGDGPVGSVIGSLDELNGLFTSWVEMVYHQAVHSGTGQTPIARWDAGWAHRRPDRRDPAVIAEAFRWSATRTVTKSATVSLQSNTYQVDPTLIGRRVELVYDPFDLTGAITVRNADGAPAGEATLVEVRRHVHKKAERAAADTDPGARTAASGIDYLRLVEARHKHTMPAASISFAELAAAAGALSGHTALEPGTETA